MDYDTAVKRINMMKGHVNPSLEAIRERKKATFSVPKAQKALWSLLPATYFQTHEAMGKFTQYPVKEICLKETDKEESRREGTEFMIELINNFYEAENMTDTDEMIDRLDEILAGLSSVVFIDSPSLVKLSTTFLLTY